MLGRAAVIASLLVSFGASARAQEPASDDVVIPDPPSVAPSTVAMSDARCTDGAEWRPDEGCVRHVDTWVPGPAPEMVGGSLAVFAVGYVVQLVSTAVSVSRGRDDVGPTYSGERLADYERWGYLPLVGPWAKLALAPPHVDDTGAGLFAFEGVLQLGGAVLFAISLFVHPVSEWRREAPLRVTPTARGLALEIPFG